MKQVLSIVFVSFLALLAKGDESTLVFPPFIHTWGIQKGTQEKLKMLLGTRTFFSDPQGLATTKLKSWDDPKNRDDDYQVIALGVNAGRGEIIYNKSMTALDVYGKVGSGKGEFDNPRGIWVTTDGKIFVADMGNHRIARMKIPKTEIIWDGEFGNDILSAPYDVECTDEGLIYVSDTAKNSIFVFDSTGRFLKEIGKDVLISPRGIAVNSEGTRWSAYKTDFIVVADSGGKRLVMFDRKTGELMAKFSFPKAGMRDADSRYIALDYHDNIYVTDFARCQIHKFDNGLVYITSFGGPGEGKGEFMEPRGIAIWRRFGQVFVAEKSSAQYYWVGVDVKNFKLSVDEKNRKINVSFLLTEHAYMTVTIESKKDSWKLSERKRIREGERNESFDIPLSISPGSYTIKFVFEATYSSYKYFQKTIERKVSF